MIKKMLVFLLLVSIMQAAAEERSIVYEDFEDGELAANPAWRIMGTNYYFKDGELHSDGSILDQSGRRVVIIFSDLNVSDFSNIILSYRGLLKSSGNPLPGVGIEMIADNTQKSYRLNIQDGNTNGFPNNKHSISLAYSADNTISDYIYTDYPPQKDVWYNVKTIRKNGVWSLYVNNTLIDSQNDTMFIKNLTTLIIGMHGSVAIDDINLTIDSEEQTQEIPDPLLYKFAPIFKFHQAEEYYPLGVEALTENAQLKRNDGVIVQEKPSYVSKIENFEETNHMYFDMINSDTEKDYSSPSIGDFENYSAKIYGRIITDENNYKHLQYFIFYPFERWYTINRESDWEMVQMTLSPANQIESVQYFFNIFTMIYYDTNLIELIDNKHPVVIVSKGNHNNYADLNPIDFGDEDYEYFNNLFGKIKTLDKVNDEGITYKPLGTNISEGEVQYTLEKIYSSSPVAEFQGRWGQQTITDLTSGQKGPRFNPRFERQWRHPEDMGYGPHLPFVYVFLYSPLDITIGTDGQDIDLNSEDVLFYTGKDEEPEAIMVANHKNYSVKLKANEEGNFTLVLFYYDNETNQGIMVKYTGIKNYAQSNARVESSKDSDYILYVDENNDLEYEKKYLPDEIIRYNGFEYSEPDFDFDLINDLKDNCPTINNPNQEDIDNDNIGDVCDTCNDPDNDTRCDPQDNCQLIYNPGQDDMDADGIGDLCDDCQDVDNDSVCYPYDNCEQMFNPGQEDNDSDNIGDSCDLCMDIDKDMACYPKDNCEDLYNPRQEDADNDGIGDLCDSCQDIDKDTICEPIDNCIEIYNPYQEDFNSDGKGDLCDNPIYYKRKALEIIKNTSASTRIGMLKLWIAQNSLEMSLSPKNWIDYFTIRTHNVFVEELVCEQYADNIEVSSLLAKADRLIVEKALVYEKEGKRYKLSKKYFDEGNSYFEKNEFRRAILKYLEAWQAIN